MTMRRFDKRVFFRLVGYKPHPGQARIHRSKARVRVVACGVRWGKSRAAAMEAIAAAMAPSGRSVGWVVGPNYGLAERVFREIELIVLTHLKPYVIAIRESDHCIILRNLSGGESEIRAKSADSLESLLGEGLDWLVCDEASCLKPRVWQNYLSQRLVDKKGWALLISTPKGKGWFYEMYRRGQGPDREPEYESWNMPSWTNPLLDKAEIEAQRRGLPRLAFAQEYGAQFAEGSGSVFRDVRECATGAWQQPEGCQAYFGGLDVARTEDFTVLTIVNPQREVVYIDRFRRLPWAAQIARVRRVADRFNHARILADSSGAGQPILESLKEAGCIADGYLFTASSKAALIQNLTIMLDQRLIVLPRPDLAPNLIEELEAYQYVTTELGHTRTSAPSGQHDDQVISLALAAWLVQHRPVPPRVSVITSRSGRTIGAFEGTETTMAKFERQRGEYFDRYSNHRRRH